MDYRVTWEIEVKATSHLEAARKAVTVQAGLEGNGGVFQVQGEEDDEPLTIDLDEEGDPQNLDVCPNCGGEGEVDDHERCQRCDGAGVTLSVAD